MRAGAPEAEILGIAQGEVVRIERGAFEVGVEDASYGAAGRESGVV